jgi:hypothetical protein
VNSFFVLVPRKSFGMSRSADSTRRVGNAVPKGVPNWQFNERNGKSVQHRQQISLYFSRRAKNNKTISQNE